jgi:hypothetical protein
LDSLDTKGRISEDTRVAPGREPLRRYRGRLESQLLALPVVSVTTLSLSFFISKMDTGSSKELTVKTRTAE